MPESLNPTLITRISRSLRADWTRTVLFRRIAAGLLVLLAGFAAVRSDPAGDRRQVVVVARDVSPGTALTAEDVALETRSAATIPDGALIDLGVLGATLAGPVRRGEVLTDVRVLGKRLADASAGPGARIVGVHPADAALVDLVHPGDVVDVVAAGSTDTDAGAGGPRILATGGVVVLVSDKQRNTTDDRVVLVALPASAANSVAGAALVQTVTLTLQ